MDLTTEPWWIPLWTCLCSQSPSATPAASFKQWQKLSNLKALTARMGTPSSPLPHIFYLWGIEATQVKFLPLLFSQTFQEGERKMPHLQGTREGMRSGVYFTWNLFGYPSHLCLCLKLTLQTYCWGHLLFTITSWRSLFFKWICKIHLAIVGMEK